MHLEFCLLPDPLHTLPDCRHTVQQLMTGISLIAFYDDYRQPCMNAFLCGHLYCTFGAPVTWWKSKTTHGIKWHSITGITCTRNMDYLFGKILNTENVLKGKNGILVLCTTYFAHIQLTSLLDLDKKYCGILRYYALSRSFIVDLWYIYGPGMSSRHILFHSIQITVHRAFCSFWKIFLTGS